jgi:hypothetical protein
MVLYLHEENVLHLNDEYELKEEHTISNDSAFEQAIEEFMFFISKRFNSFRLTIDNTKKVLTHSYWPIHWIGVNNTLLAMIVLSNKRLKSLC